MAETLDVAIVGGGPAGAALAIHLAKAGIATTVFERRARPAWHASGVFSSPLTRGRLAALGLPPSAIAALQRPISALLLETTGGAACRIDYDHGYACGFDRLALESTLLERAAQAGATLRQGAVVRHVQLPAGAGEPASLIVSATAADAAFERVAARIVVGADGPTSLVARAAGVYARNRFLDRSGITFHRPDRTAGAPGASMVGRFVFGHGWYAGIAPVPGDRVNVGIVASRTSSAHLDPHAVAGRVIDSLPGRRQPWMDAPTTDRIATAGRLEHHARRAAGNGWLLVGDAIGFIDPLTGEGILRALVSAEMAAAAIDRTLRGDRRALEVYDRRLRNRYLGKNVVSWMLQLFLAQPAVFDYTLRRLGRRADLRAALTDVLTDRLLPAHVVNPRFVARLLAP